MRYEYRHSGIDWIGDVPKHWRKEKIFRAAELITSGGTPRSGNEDYYEGDIYWIQSGDLNDGYVTDTEKKITQEGLDNSSAKLFPAGTLLVAMYGATIGKLGIQTMEAATNQACCGIYPTKRIDLKFLFYFFHAVKDKYISDSYGGGQPNISQSVIKQTYFFVPEKTEQIAIANYLDKACADIERVVEIKRKQIENLQQQLKSIIHHTVTKGLNPKAEMKESGIDWIGEVPKHWKYYRLKDILEKIGSGVTPKGGAAEYLDAGIPLIRSQNVLDDKLIFEDIAFISNETHSDMSNSQVKNGDVLLNITGASLGRCFYYSSTEEANVNQHVCILRPFKKIETKYLHLLMISDWGQKQIEQGFTGSGREGLNFKSIKRFSFILPSRDEQIEIIKHLENISNKAKSVQSKIEKQIEVILNYKKSLIHEVVTGKKQVYNV